jgi:hypothetical protein
MGKTSYLLYPLLAEKGESSLKYSMKVVKKYLWN